MIPARSAKGEHVGIEVRYRVAACRKRLRDHRPIRKLPIAAQLGEQLSEIDSSGGVDQSGSFEQEEDDR